MAGANNSSYAMRVSEVLQVRFSQTQLRNPALRIAATVNNKAKKNARPRKSDKIPEIFTTFIA